jgi:TonB family protein
MILSSLFYYLLFSSLFYLSYRVLYSGSSFHRINRILLLSSIPLALLIAIAAPQFSLPWLSSVTASFQLPEIIIEGNKLDEQLLSTSSSFSLWKPIYSIGLVISSLYFFSGLYYIFQLAKNSSRFEVLNHQVLTNDKIKSPFCIGKWIFIPKELLKSKDLELIVQHELYHSRLNHHWDRIYYKILTTLFWFDPSIHLLAKELRQLHELEVDALLIRQGNIENYAHLLLSSTLGGDLAYPEKAISPSPFFNSSFIKTRITMLYQKESPAWKKSLYLTVIPLLAAMTLLACNKSTEESPQQKRETASESAISIAEVDHFPIAQGCDISASADEAKECAFQSIMNHISQNFEYPALAEELGIEGRIFVQFVISKSGRVESAQIIRSIDTENEDQAAAVIAAEKEAIAVLSSLPDFAVPAQQNGKAVAVQMVLPISLKLS